MSPTQIQCYELKATLAYGRYTFGKVWPLVRQALIEALSPEGDRTQIVQTPTAILCARLYQNGPFVLGESTGNLRLQILPVEIIG